MADDILTLDIGVNIQLREGDPFASWSFEHRTGGGDATEVRLFIGQRVRITYQLTDPSSWRLEAASLRRVSSDASHGFVTLTSGQTTQPHALQEGAGTVAVSTFSADSLVVDLINTLSTNGEPFTVGLSLTASTSYSQAIPKQSSQDPQMVLEPRTVPPPPTL